MSLGVVLLVGLAAVAAGAIVAWGRAVLGDEDRYVRAVTRLPVSTKSGELAAWAVGAVIRRRFATAQVATIASGFTRRGMRTRVFARTWAAGHRRFHRHRSGRRAAVAMLTLAAAGEIVGGLDAISALRRRRASA